MTQCPHFTDSGCTAYWNKTGPCIGTDFCHEYKNLVISANDFKQQMRNNGLSYIPKAYIAGPYRSNKGEYFVKQNIRNAEDVAMQLRDLGFACYVPHMNSSICGGRLPDSFWLAEGLTFMHTCDCVVVQGNWQASEGTREEIASATRANIPVFYWDNANDRERLILFLAKFSKALAK